MQQQNEKTGQNKIKTRQVESWQLGGVGGIALGMLIGQVYTSISSEMYGFAFFWTVLLIFTAAALITGLPRIRRPDFYLDPETGKPARIVPGCDAKTYEILASRPADSRGWRSLIKNEKREHWHNYRERGEFCITEHPGGRGWCCSRDDSNGSRVYASVTAAACAMGQRPPIICDPLHRQRRRTD
ncbi:MAG: hypothetical protein ISN29_01330 [Gammaproteobacteria bacterium AqS3]|nr:hypothetical protein [Gammaproteobacteria bacterium AqS3]